MLKIKKILGTKVGTFLGEHHHLVELFEFVLNSQIEGLQVSTYLNLK